MKKILLVICILVFCFVTNEAKAQDNPCLALTWPHGPTNEGGFIVNPDSVLEDTCQDSPTYRHKYANKRFDVDFSENVFFGALASRGIIKKLDDIDSLNFLETKEGLNLLQDVYGEFWFERDTDTLHGDDTTPFFTLYFKNYIEVSGAQNLLRAVDRVKKVYFASNPIGLVSVQNTEMIAGIDVYPNPTSENITISLPQNLSFKTTKLTLRDITGRQIFLKEIDALQDSYTFSVQKIPSGVYLLEVRSGNESFTKQVSVIR